MIDVGASQRCFPKVATGSEALLHVGLSRHLEISEKGLAELTQLPLNASGQVFAEMLKAARSDPQPDGRKPACWSGVKKAEIDQRRLDPKLNSLVRCRSKFNAPETSAVVALCPGRGMTQESMCLVSAIGVRHKRSLI